MTASAAPEFGPPLIGQTESALEAILARELEETGLDKSQWIVLSLAAAGEGVRRQDLAARAAAALRISDADADGQIGDLAASLKLRTSGPQIQLTESGQTVLTRVRGSVAEITQRLWGDLCDDDLATAARVLSIVLDRAGAELAGA